MLDLSRKASDIAEDIHAELGQQAFSFASIRVEEARQASDERGVRLWSDVGSELLTLGRPSHGCDGTERSASLWRLMQRIEYYRHRASEAECRAAEAPEICQKDMLEAAVQWRDLALHAELAAAAVQAGERAMDSSVEPERRRRKLTR